MELSQLVFSAKTDDLERASKAIGALATDLSNLNKVSRESAQTESTLAKAAKANADAALQNAKAQDVRLKSTIAADKADQSTEKSVKKSTEATERHTRAVKANADILTYQTDRAKFMAEGFSSGNASTLAQAKALGQLSAELKNILDLQRSFQGNISFDKSDMGIKRLTKSYNEATESQKLFAEGTSLTIDQARELSRDQNRIAASMKFMGKSMDEVTAAQKVYANEYNNVASAYNRIDAAEKSVIKQRKEVVSATNYLTQADQKMAAALNVSNKGLDLAGTDLLVKYEVSLRKSGIAQAAATNQLGVYKTQLQQVQALEQKRREQHLSRALMPQVTDVAVSLWSGQSPLTVLLQQGGQVLDLFNQSGIAAEKFAESVKTSMKAMLPSIMTVVKGVGTLIVDGLLGAGNAMVDFVGKTLHFNTVLEVMNKGLNSVGWGVSEKGIQRLTKGFAMLAAGLLTGTVVALGALAVGFKQVVQEENALAKAMALSGATMGISHLTAIQYATSMEKVGVTTSRATAVITEMAKSGVFVASEIGVVTKAAVDLEKYAGIAIADTVKSFAKLKEKPVEAMIELAKSSGMVSEEVLKQIVQMQKVGDVSGAITLAMTTMADVNKQQVSRMKEDYNGLALSLMELGRGIKDFFSDMFKTVFSANLPTTAIENELRVQADKARSLREKGFTPDSNISLRLAEQQVKLLSEQINKTMNLSTVEAKRRERSSAAAKAIDENEQLAAKYSDNVTKSKQEIIKLEAKRIEWKEKGLLTDEREKTLAVAITAERKKINDELNKNKDKKTESFFESSMKTLRNNTIEAAVANDGLVESQIKLLQIIKDPAFAKMTETQKLQIMQTGAAAIATEQQAEAVKQLEKAEEFRLKVLGKSEGVGKQYYSDMEALMKYAKTAGWTTEQVEEMTRAIYTQTPAWKEHEKALESSRQVLSKINEESIAYQVATSKENEELDYRVALLGRTTEEQKVLSVEYKKEQKLTENRIKLAKELRDIEEGLAKAKKNGLGNDDLNKYEDAKLQAMQNSAERERAINRETAVIYAEDLQREIDSIKSGISDSIVTALFEGGKEGSKKLRQVLVDVLRKKVTIVVDAVVNTLLGSVVGSLLGGAGGGAGGSLLGSAAASVGGSLLGGATGIGTGASLLSGFSGTTLPLGMVGPSVAAPTMMSGIGSALSAVPVWGWVLAGALVFGKKLFGRTLKDTGIQGTFGGESGFEGDSYKFYKGGLFRSDKTTTEQLDEPTRKALGDSFITMRKQVLDFAKVLGLNTGKLEDFSTSLKLSFKDLDEAGIQKKVQEALETANNEMAQQVIGTWTNTSEEVKKQVASTAAEMESGADAYTTVTETVTKSTYVASEYAKEGEKAIDTLTRLAVSLSTVNSVFEILGVTLFDASLIGADAASKLIDAFGTLEEFTASTSYFYENFYSQEEKATVLKKQLQKEFDKLGIALPKTKDGFRELVNSFDLTTEEGRKAYAAVMKLAPGFVQLFEGQDALLQAEQDRIDESIRAQREAAKAAVDTALSNLRDAINREKEALNAQLNTAEATKDKIKQVFDTLSGAVDSLYAQAISTSDSAKQGQDFINKALQQVIATGILPDNKEISAAISKVNSNFGMDNFESSAERRYAQLKFAGELKTLKDISGDQLTESEYQIKLIKDQIEQLDKTLQYWEDQVNATQDNVEATLSVETAIGALQTALEVALSDGFSSISGTAGKELKSMLTKLASGESVPTSEEAIDQLITSIGSGDISLKEAVNYISGTPKKSKLYEDQVEAYKNVTPEEYYAELRKNADILINEGKTADELSNILISMGVSLTDVARAYGTSAAEIAANLLRGGAKQLPHLAVGTNFVPEDMPAMIHKGERIIPAADNSELMQRLQGGTSNDLTRELIGEVRALRRQNENLELRLNYIQQNTKITNEILDQVTEGGNAMRTTTI